jgi:signal transduction histidine kinase
MAFCSIGISWLILYFNINVNLYIKATKAQFAAREQEIKAIAQIGKFAAIGQLAGGIAHEINNPVAIIRGKAEIIGEYQKRQGITDDFIRKHLDGIIQTTQRISQITHSMLSLSRADSGDKNSFDVKKAILETVSMCRDSMAKHGITIKSQLEVLDPNVEAQGSRGHFQQAVMNLLTNARDALLEAPPSDPAWIEIVAHRSSQGLGIEISDNGPGITVANAERIMDPFFTTKQVGKGTGLGLSLSKTLMEAQGGQLILVHLKNPTTFRLVLVL